MVHNTPPDKGSNSQAAGAATEPEGPASSPEPLASRAQILAEEEESRPPEGVPMSPAVRPPLTMVSVEAGVVGGGCLDMPWRLVIQKTFGVSVGSIGDGDLRARFVDLKDFELTDVRRVSAEKTTNTSKKKDRRSFRWASMRSTPVSLTGPQPV